MSYVTNVILATWIDDGGSDDKHPNVNILNAWLEKRWGKLTQVNQLATNNSGKVMECDIFMGAFNYLDVEGFVAAFRAIPWEMPESAQLLMKTEQEKQFKMFYVSAP